MRYAKGLGNVPYGGREDRGKGFLHENWLGERQHDVGGPVVALRGAHRYASLVHRDRLHRFRQVNPVAEQRSDGTCRRIAARRDARRVNLLGSTGEVKQMPCGKFRGRCAARAFDARAEGDLRALDGVQSLDRVSD